MSATPLPIMYEVMAHTYLPPQRGHFTHVRSESMSSVNHSVAAYEFKRMCAEYEHVALITHEMGECGTHTEVNRVNGGTAS